MLTFQLPEISPLAGPAADGVVRGEVDSSSMTSSYSSIQQAVILYAIREDVGEGFNFVDVSAEAISGTPDALLPWGPTETFGAGDTLYVAIDGSQKDLYFKITTPGVWAGSAGNHLDIYDSSDGISANRLMTGIVDDTDGFTAEPGIYRVSFTRPDTPPVAFSPVPGSIASRQWLAIKPHLLTGVTTAPAMSNLWAIQDVGSIKYVEATAFFNAAMDDNTFDESSEVFLAAGDQVIFNFPFPAYGADFAVFKKATLTETVAHEYLASDNTWKAIPNWTDDSDEFRNGPATLGSTPDLFRARWTLPSDWASKTLELPILFGPTISSTGYFIRYRVLTAEAGPVHPPLLRARVRAFGTANSYGVYHHTAASYTTATFDIGVPAGDPLVMQLVNINTGAGADFTIDDSIISSGQAASQHLALSTQLTVRAGESLLVACVAGGTATDIEFRLE